jgi:hypothetical protein
MKTVLFLAVSLVARAQLSLTACSNPSSPIQSTYTFGPVAAGLEQDVDFCILNNGTSSAAVNLISVSGAGFALNAINGKVPGVVAPSNSLRFTVGFVSAPSAALGSYSASLVITPGSGAAMSVVLLATLIPAPAVTIFPPCQPIGTTTINFGTLTNHSVHGCEVMINNQSSAAMVVSSIAVTGPFEISGAPAFPVTLTPNATPAFDFSIDTTPGCGTTAINGTLVITAAGGTFTYQLTAQGADPPLPQPSFMLDSMTLASGQQHTLSISLASPAVCPAKGSVNLAFSSTGNIPVPDDASIMFLSGSSRTLPFTADAGSSTVSINRQPSATFQTGTTAGVVTFSLTGTSYTGNPTLILPIPAAPIVIETAVASNQRTGELDINIVGFDNTYSAGAMTFTFQDSSGKAIGSPVTADFTSNFHSYFATQNAGSFLVRVSFPVTGNASQIATVSVTLANSAGSTSTGTLTFE